MEPGAARRRRTAWSLAAIVATGAAALWLRRRGGHDAEPELPVSDAQPAPGPVAVVLEPAPQVEAMVPAPLAEPATAAMPAARAVARAPRAASGAPRPATRSPRRRALLLAAVAAAVIASVGGAVALGALGGRDGNAAPAGSTSEVLGVQTSSAETDPVEAPPAAVAALPRATRATALRARGTALLDVPYASLADLVGSRVRAGEARVGAVVGDDVFWVGRGSDRILVHLQGDSTLYAVRRGQRVTFSGVLSATRPGAAAQWGVTLAEGRRQLERQGHHIEVYGPDMRFDCVRSCVGY
jgi:hypothetical protein